MIITFCGHSNFSEAERIEPILLSLLREEIGKEPAELFLGGYGRFDEFAYMCGRKLKEECKGSKKIKLTFVTPYITESYQRNNVIGHGYDEILYPEIEKTPLRFAISARNKWMIDKADFVIAYVNHDRGGAFKSYNHAVRRRKRIINLGRLK